MSRWNELRTGSQSAIAEVFPEASPTIPVGEPLAVMWNVSKYLGGSGQFRFVAPSGASYPFTLDEIIRAADKPIVFGR